MCLLLRHGGATLEVHEHFQRRTFRNRTTILTDHGPLDLSLPLRHGNRGSVKQNIQEVLLDEKANGPLKHWRALETSYAKAPFFEHYAPYFEAIFRQPPPDLFTLNHQLLTLCLKLTQIDIKLDSSKEFVKSVGPEELDCRDSITPRASYALRSWYRPTPYYQVFGDNFIPNLSIVDLLFCEGPRSPDILWQSVEKEVT